MQHTKDTATTHPAPDVIARMELVEGLSTPRDILICSHDADHDVVTDAWAAWDEELQHHVHEDQLSGDVCNDCDGPLECETIRVSNRVALMDLRASLLDLRNTLARKATTLDTSGWTRLVCESCGSEGLRLDAYSRYDPVSNDFSHIVTFDGGHSCEDCGDDASPEHQLMSAHERLMLIARIHERIESLDRQMIEVDEWLLSQGWRYELEQRDYEAIQTRLETAA